MSPGFLVWKTGLGIGQEGKVMRKLVPRQEDPIMVCVQIDGRKERKKKDGVGVGISGGRG